MEDQGMVAGSIIKDTYQLTQKIGAGGMGEVWEAHNPRVPRVKYAIKFLFGYTRGTEQFDRFEREAHILMSLNHNHITKIHDYDPNYFPPFIALEYLEGQPLSKRIQGRNEEGERGLPLQEILHIVSQVGDALQVTHQQGIIHRDLKPENIFLCDQAHTHLPLVKVLDFGVSKISGGQQITQHQHGFLGTPHYMSPEQALGNENVDHRADQFSLAIIIYEMLSGELPFKGEQIVQIATQIVHGDPPYIRELCPELSEEAAQALHRAFCKSPHDRFESCQALIDAFSQGASLPSVVDDWSMDSKTEIGIRRSLMMSSSPLHDTHESALNHTSERAAEGIEERDQETMQMAFNRDFFHEAPQTSSQPNKRSDPFSFPAPQSSTPYSAPYADVPYGRDQAEVRSQKYIVIGATAFILMFMFLLIPDGEKTLYERAEYLRQLSPRPGVEVTQAGEQLIETLSLIPRDQLSRKKVSSQLRKRQILPPSRYELTKTSLSFLLQANSSKLTKAVLRQELEAHWFSEDQEYTKQFTSLRLSGTDVRGVVRADISEHDLQPGRWVLLVTHQDQLLVSFPFEVRP